ncbi:superoxide dismutase family protein [Fictibacillus phosphorivorans]|uniref:superoxide dismutase family protein n=1 Tax=Fictibacillus phosphorivorans TaxID=1221500 RepID=UPI00203AC2D4|nr:superoxide dismutase family protein [Fictibacillus phosphorivorans]MCM3718202.1 superoxide dismutase family protein [Fictibacillus phosphorivorans]MCM3775931.1 superoxide dismutase family protein [Fictibacillus phosphorivorans]
MILKKILKTMLLIVLIVILASCGNKKEDEHKDHEMEESQAASSRVSGSYIVNLVNTKGKKAGEATLTETAEGVTIEVNATGLKPGEHGIHFHEKAICTPPDFKSTGSHFNPTSKQHGFLNPKGPHVGDILNITANKSGVVQEEILSTMVSLSGKKSNSLFSNGGTALVIHAGADDYKTDPAGNSGDRVLCGEIKK